MLVLPVSAPARDIYVSPTGNDNASGNQSAPYRTLTQAASVAVAGDVVTIAGGTYHETLAPANRGYENDPIVFQGAPGQKVIISAMEPVSGFTLHAGDIYRASVPWNLGQENFVMHEQTALDLARWPNNVDGDPFTADTVRNTGGSGPNVGLNAYLDYAPGLPAGVDWSNGGSIHFYGDKPGSGWLAWRAFIDSSSSTRVGFDARKDTSWIVGSHAPADLGEFFLQGVLGALDHQNEWYLDPTAGYLYVQLPGGVAPVDGAVQMRAREKTIDIDGRHYIEIRDLAVFGGEITLGGHDNKLYRVSSFYGSNTLGVVSGFNSGSASVRVGWTMRDNVIEQCEVAFGAGSGIQDNGTNTQVINSYVHDFGTLGSYDAVLNARTGTGGGLYLNNTLRRGGRDTIASSGPNQEFAYNDVSEAGLLADDCALFYTVGNQNNTSLHHNWFHDTASTAGRVKIAGIYLDNDPANMTVYRNIVSNTVWSNIQMNWDARNIDIFNNTFVFGSRTMGAWHKAGTAFDIPTVRVYNNLSDRSEWEPQATKLNNVTYSQNPFVDTPGDDYSLVAGSQPVDAGTVIPVYTDGFVGSAPDVGALERGVPAFTVGIDWDIALGPTGQGCYGLPGETCGGSAPLPGSAPPTTVPAPAPAPAPASPPPASSTCNVSSGAWNYCTECGPCGVGEGDCDGDGECMAGLVCNPNGAAYGLPASFEVCEMP